MENTEIKDMTPVEGGAPEVAKKSFVKKAAEKVGIQSKDDVKKKGKSLLKGLVCVAGGVAGTLLVEALLDKKKEDAIEVPCELHDEVEATAVPVYTDVVADPVVDQVVEF